MKTFVATVIALLAVWSEVSLVAPLRPLGVVPNLALVVMVVLVANLAASAGLVLAAMVGLFLDLSSGSNFGLQTGFYLLLVLSLNLLERLGTECGSFGVMAGLVTAGTLILNGAIATSLAISGGRLRLGFVAHETIIELICNLVLLAVLRWLLMSLLPKSRDSFAIGPQRG